MALDFLAFGPLRAGRAKAAPVVGEPPLVPDVGAMQKISVMAREGLAVGNEKAPDPRVFGHWVDKKKVLASYRLANTTSRGPGGPATGSLGRADAFAVPSWGRASDFLNCRIIEILNLAEQSGDRVSEQIVATAIIGLSHEAYGHKYQVLAEIAAMTDPYRSWLSRAFG